MNGLHCSVLRSHEFSDCTNGGVTANVNTATLIGDGITGPFEPDEDAPAVWLVYDLEPRGANAGYLMAGKPDWLAKLHGSKRPGSHDCLREDWASQHRIVRVRAVPLDDDGEPRTGGMFGGNFIETSDSRMPVHGPIPVFDRFE